MLRFAYNTNGMQSHRLGEALALLGDTGYHGVALTLDHMHLDPTNAGPADLRDVKRALKQHRLSCCIETGARYVLDPRRKHRPTLCDADPLGRMARVDLLRRSLEIASELEAEVLNLPAGPRDPGQDAAAAWCFLVEGLRELLALGAELGVRVALEPEPGHLVQTLEEHARLRAELPELLLTLDVAHVSVAAAEGTPAEAIRANAEALALVHLEDAPRGVHAHLPFGEGDLNLGAVLGALEAIDFGGLCAVELSRHSHAAHELVPATLERLRSGS